MSWEIEQLRKELGDKIDELDKRTQGDIDGVIDDNAIVKRQVELLLKRVHTLEVALKLHPKK